MYPVLFKVGSFAVDSYYVIWFAALSLAMMWTVRRFPLYGVDEDEGRRVVAWAFVGMLVGARAFEYLWNFKTYLSSPALIFDLNRGGLSEVGAFTGAFITAVALCWRDPHVSFTRLCDVVAPPVILTMIVGRWGCFCAGCCVGIETSVPWGVHFPKDILGVFRHPTQVYYSLCSLVILLIMLYVERKTVKRGLVSRYALIMPIGLVLYSVMRIVVGLYRLQGAGMALSNGVVLAALPFELLWLWFSLRDLKSPSKA